MQKYECRETINENSERKHRGSSLRNENVLYVWAHDLFKALIFDERHCDRPQLLVIERGLSVCS